MLSAAPSFSCVASRVMLTGQRPSRSSLPSRQRQLVDQPVRRGRVHEPPAGVRERARVRDLCAARPVAVAGRDERPQHRPAVGVDRDRLAVAGGGEESRCGSLRRPARRVGRSARSRPCPPASRSAVAGVATFRARDPRRAFADVAALRIEVRTAASRAAVRPRAAFDVGIALAATVGVEVSAGALLPHDTSSAQTIATAVANVRLRPRASMLRCSTAWGLGAAPVMLLARRSRRATLEDARMARTPQVGEQAPDFELPGTAGAFRLSEHRGERVVLLFYPGDNTMVCTKQFCSYRESRCRLRRR